MATNVAPTSARSPDHGEDQDQDDTAPLRHTVRIVDSDSRATPRRHDPPLGFRLTGRLDPPQLGDNKTIPRVETRGVGFRARSADPKLFRLPHQGEDIHCG
jgi:hypothetical protein